MWAPEAPNNIATPAEFALFKSQQSTTLRFFYAKRAFLVSRFYNYRPNLAPLFDTRSRFMDIAFVIGIAALWGVAALLVVGFKGLEKPAGARP